MIALVQQVCILVAVVHSICACMIAVAQQMRM